MARLALTCAVFVAAGILTPSIATAQPTADVYKDRTLTILVGYGAGGTYGQTSILLARHFKRHIPGEPTVIVQHMPGAGGLKAANFAYNAMPKRGLNVLMPPEMTVASQMLRPKKVKYKSDRFTWLGVAFGSNHVMMVRRDTGITSIEDLRKKQVIVGATGTGSPTYLVPAMMNGVLGTKFKIVTGYKGSAANSLAVERGEAFGMSNSWVSWKANRPHWFNKPSNNFAVKLTQIGFTKEKDLPDLPLLSDLATNADDKAAVSILSTASVIGRGLVFPPGVPSSLIGPMRTAFWNTVNDPAFKADAEKRKLPVTPMKGEDIQNTIETAMKQMSPAAVARARKYIFGK